MRAPADREAVRRPLLALLAVPLVTLALAAGAAAGVAPGVSPAEREGTTAASPWLRVVAFAGTTRSGARQPADAVKPGGTYGSCRLDDLERLYAFVRFRNMRAGGATSVAWALEGTEIFVDRFGWDLGARGRGFFFVHAGGDTMPDGHYTVEIRVAGKLLARASVTRVTQYC